MLLYVCTCSKPKWGNENVIKWDLKLVKLAHIETIQVHNFFKTKVGHQYSGWWLGSREQSLSYLEKASSEALFFFFLPEWWLKDRVSISWGNVLTVTKLALNLLLFKCRFLYLLKWSDCHIKIENEQLHMQIISKVQLLLNETQCS